VDFYLELYIYRFYYNAWWEISVLLIGLISKYFASSVLSRVGGALFGACLFYLITNFGVWTGDLYGYNIGGLLTSYVLALLFLDIASYLLLFFQVLLKPFTNFQNQKKD